MKAFNWKWVYRSKPAAGRELKHPFLMMSVGDVVEYSDVKTVQDALQLSLLCESYNKTYRAKGLHFDVSVNGEETCLVKRVK